MSAEPTNGQSNIDVILKAMAPDRREAFLRSRNRLQQFNENDEVLALAHYLDTVMVMVDGLTKNVAAAMTAHTEPMANLTAQLKRVAAELPSHANTLTPKTIRRWLACWAASILLVAPSAFFWGWISAQREQSNRLAARCQSFLRIDHIVRSGNNRKAQRHMKKVLAIKTPVGGIVQIIPRDDSDTAVGLSWREVVLSDAEKEASRLYLFDEGFIEHAAGSLEPDLDIQRFLRDIIDSN